MLSTQIFTISNKVTHFHCQVLYTY